MPVPVPVVIKSWAKAKGINGFLGSAFSSVNERFLGSILTERLRQFDRQRGILKVKI